jgi:hypothetical protein
MNNEYAAQLQERLFREDLTAYGAAHLVAAELDSDERIESMIKRIERYLQKDPESLTKYAEIVRGLGGELVINWKTNNQNLPESISTTL